MPKDSDLQPLHVAAQEGHTAITQFLVEARARVEASDADEAFVVLFFRLPLNRLNSYLALTLLLQAS